MSRYYLLKGKVAVPVSNTLEAGLEWAKLFEGGNCRVAFNKIGDISISTIFLGLNHQFGEGLPLIFETMIFGGEHDQYQDRYSTWEEAEKGHKVAIELVQKHMTRRPRTNSSRVQAVKLPKPVVG